MGHKVSAEVRKRYNHKDKRGVEKMAEKAREVFGILDEWLFGTTEKEQQGGIAPQEKK
jgi:hypothetical protein